MLGYLYKAAAVSVLWHSLPCSVLTLWLCRAETPALGHVVSILVSRQIVPARAGHVAELIHSVA